MLRGVTGDCAIPGSVGKGVYFLHSCMRVCVCVCGWAHIIMCVCVSVSVCMCVCAYALVQRQMLHQFFALKYVKVRVSCLHFYVRPSWRKLTSRPWFCFCLQCLHILLFDAERWKGWRLCCWISVLEGETAKQIRQEKEKEKEKLRDKDGWWNKTSRWQRGGRDDWKGWQRRPDSLEINARWSLSERLSRTTGRREQTRGAEGDVWGGNRKLLILLVSLVKLCFPSVRNPKWRQEL